MELVDEFMGDGKKIRSTATMQNVSEWLKHTSSSSTAESVDKQPCSYSVFINYIVYILIFNISHSERRMEPYFESHQRGGEHFSDKCHSCSVCQLDFQTTERNRYSKSVPTLLRISWMIVLISVVILRFKLQCPWHKSLIPFVP